MVEVKECSKEITKQFFLQKNLPYTAAESRAITALENEEVLGSCLFNMDKCSITVLSIEPDSNITMADSMLRSALFIAANRGIMEAYFEAPLESELIKRLGFLGNVDNRTIDITNLFGPCGCQK